MESYKEPYMDKSAETGVGANENFKRFIQCKNREELIDFYTKWAKDDSYDEHMKGGYAGPKCVAQALARHCEGRYDISILDVAAGTGLAAQELKAMGFTGPIDALDASEGMLDEAKKTNVYNKFYQCYFGDGDESRCIAADTYDALISSGAVGYGHMDASVLPEMVRVVKPGGLISLTIPKDALIDDEEKGRAVVFSRLEESGELKQLEKTPLPDFYFGLEGEILVLKVCKTN